jgi:hypothetical protein
MSDALAEALRRKFKTPRDAVLALGLDADLLNINTKERTTDMTTKSVRSGRYAYDEEAGSAELREMLDDKEINIGDLIAAAIEYAPNSGQEELYSSLRQLGEDKRGPRAWARDRLERRKLGKDMRARRARDQSETEAAGYHPDNSYSRDEPEPFSGRPRPGGSMDPVRPDFEGLDRRRLGSDMALDGRRERITAENYVRRVFGG